MIEMLTDDQLDGIAGGTALPQSFDKFTYTVQKGTAIRIGYAGTHSSSGSFSQIASITSGYASREYVERRLDLAERAGATSVTFYQGAQDKTGTTLPIADVRAMLNS